MDTGSRNLQIVAWSVLWATLAAWLAVVIGGPMWARAYLRSAMVDYEATVACKAGSVALSAGNDMGVLTPDQGARALSEGWSVETLGGAQAFLDFSDRAPGSDDLGPTVTLDAGIRLNVVEIRKPRFRWGQSPRRVVLAARPTTDQPGGLSVGTPWDATVVRIQTPTGASTWRRSRAPAWGSAACRRTRKPVRVRPPPIPCASWPPRAPSP